MLFNQIPKLMGWPFAIIYLLLMLGFTYFLFVTIPTAFKNKQWPQATGKVTATEVVKTQRKTKKGKPVIVYSAKISYQYMVDGQQYTGHQKKWVDSNRPEIIAQTMQTKHPINSAIALHYDPEQPAQSVLKTGLTTGHWLAGILMLFGIIWMTLRILSKQ